jgi:hypothetical protein
VQCKRVEDSNGHLSLVQSGSLRVYRSVVGGAGHRGQLDQLFAWRGIADVSAHSTKWRRIHISLLARQEADRCGNHVAAFITATMSPGRHVNDHGRYETVRSALNKVLVFGGLYLGEDTLS